VPPKRPNRNPIFVNAFYDFEASEKKKAQAGAEAASAAARAIVLCVSLDAQKCI
jgi:hypothetical protein